MSVILPDAWGNVGGSGKSMSQLGDEWWKRAFGIPEDSNPLVKDDVTDPRGRRGSVERANEFNAGVSEPIFFLGGSFESRSDLPNPIRSVIIDEGDVIVLPTINGALPDPVENPPGDFPDEATTRENVTIGFFGEGEDLISVDSTVSIDGVEVGNFAESDRNTNYRRESPEGGFSYVVPDGNWSGVPPQMVEPAVADGYWFAYDTDSLSSGEDNTVNFTGNYAEGAFTLDVTYNILNPIEGDNGKNNLPGTEGNDYIDGKNGKDELLGKKGDDLLVGGNSKDLLDGGFGSDELWGDKGKDTFIYEVGYGADTIFDFEVGEVVKLGDFADFDIANDPLANGVSAARISFKDDLGKLTGDTLTFVNVDKDDLLVNLADDTITLF